MLITFQVECLFVHVSQAFPNVCHARNSSSLCISSSFFRKLPKQFSGHYREASNWLDNNDCIKSHIAVTWIMGFCPELSNCCNLTKVILWINFYCDKISIRGFCVKLFILRGGGYCLNFTFPSSPWLVRSSSRVMWMLTVNTNWCYFHLQYVYSAHFSLNMFSYIEFSALLAFPVHWLEWYQVTMNQ